MDKANNLVYENITMTKINIQGMKHYNVLGLPVCANCFQISHPGSMSEYDIDS